MKHAIYSFIDSTIINLISYHSPVKIKHNFNDVAMHNFEYSLKVGGRSGVTMDIREKGITTRTQVTAAAQQWFYVKHK
jgi:hypothetical protein